MRSRSVLATTAALVAPAGTVWALASPADAAPGPGPGPLPGVCQHRVCLVVLDPANDSDGDGVTDVDERDAGTDPNDPTSYPGALTLIDLAMGSVLTSFDRHLTEIVILPTMTPSHESLATGFGAFALPAKAWLANNPRDGLAKIRGNGFSDRIGAATGLLQSNDTKAPPWGHSHDVSLYADGPLSQSPNGNQSGTYVGGHQRAGGGRSPEVVFGGDTTYYSFDWVNGDGSRDEATTWSETNLSGNQVNGASYDSYNSEGKKVGHTDATEETEKDPKTGDTSSYLKSDTTHYDPDTGDKTGSTTTTVEVSVHDGVKTTTTTKIYFDKNGNETGGDSTSESHACEDKICDGGGYYDPEYIAPGPVTGDDLARVVTRINASRTPGPDTGRADIYTGGLPRPRWPLVALMDPDGVVVLATAITPRFNSAQPEYDPRLRELAPLAGINPPVHNDNGTTSWPGGDGKP